MPKRTRPTTMLSTLFLELLLVSCLCVHVSCFGVPRETNSRMATSLSIRSLGATLTAAKKVDDTAQELLPLLIDHVKTKGMRGKNPYIEELIQKLVEQQVKFDPVQCLNGILYAVAYQSGPAPFWVRYSQLSPNSINIEGQQYTFRDDKGFDVINYGEFFGKAITVQARGVAYQERNEDETTCPKVSLFDSLFQNNENSSNILQCPVSFDVDVDRACCSFLERSFALDIRGSAKFTVLYADPNMRILTTKASSQIEEKGFSAVQIRVDYLEPEFPLLTYPL